LLGTFLAFNHLSLKDVALVDLNPAQMARAISNGDVDAIIVWDPYTYQIKKLLGENAIGWSGQSGQDFYFLLITREDIIKDNPLAINRFLKAMVQAEEFIIRANKEAKKIIASRLNTEPTYIQSVWAKNRFTVYLLQDILIAMEDEAGWMIKNHLTDKAKIPNYLHFIYLNGLKLVKPKGVTVIH
jgi:NitT/TauT family transport system substrate-binding protein